MIEFLKLYRRKKDTTEKEENLKLNYRNRKESISFFYQRGGLGSTILQMVRLRPCNTYMAENRKGN